MAFLLLLIIQLKYEASASLDVGRKHIRCYKPSCTSLSASLVSGLQGLVTLSLSFLQLDIFVNYHYVLLALPGNRL